MFLAVDSEGTRLDVRQLLSPLPHVSVVTVIDILLVAVIIYEFLAIIRGTRAALMVVGVAALALAFYFARIGELTTLNWLISTLLPYAVFALIVVFQGELRQALARLGRKLTFRSAMSSEADAYDDIVLAAGSPAFVRLAGYHLPAQRTSARWRSHHSERSHRRCSLLPSAFDEPSTLHSTRNAPPRRDRDYRRDGRDCCNCLRGNRRYQLGSRRQDRARRHGGGTANALILLAAPLCSPHDLAYSDCGWG